MLSITAVILAAAIAAADVAPSLPQAALPTAAEIVQKNSQARGGAERWRALRSMTWNGHTESGGAPGRRMPFLLEQERPDRMRFEIVSESGPSIRIFDGSAGWKVYPDSAGRPQAQSYSDEEVRFARGAQVIDGPLMDYASKGAVFKVEGIGKVEGRKSFVLDATLPSGGHHRLWVDAETFLEVRQDREVHTAFGRPQVVTVHYRDYREFDGLQIPLTIETAAADGKATNKLVIERVALNPRLDPRDFEKPPQLVARHRGVLVDTRSAAASIASKPAR